MISREDAVQITNASKTLRGNPRQAKLEPFVEEAEAHIRDAAALGRNKVVWTVGTNEFVEDVLRILREQGFIASYSVFSFTVEW